MTISDTPSFGITYDCHSNDSRGVIYDLNIFIIQATGEAQMSIEEEKDDVFEHFEKIQIIIKK